MASDVVGVVVGEAFGVVGVVVLELCSGVAFDVVRVGVVELCGGEAFGVLGVEVWSSAAAWPSAWYASWGWSAAAVRQ